MVREQGCGVLTELTSKMLAKTGLGKDQTDMEGQGQGLVEKRAQRARLKLDGESLCHRAFLRTLIHSDFMWSFLCR